MYVVIDINKIGIFMKSELKSIFDIPNFLQNYYTNT